MLRCSLYAGSGLIFLASCTSLPDTSAYTAASYRLQSTSVAAGKLVDNEFERLIKVVPEDQAQNTLDEAGKFKAAWASTTTSLAAMARYAESVEKLANAGNSGKESADRLSDSIGGLVQMIRATPGGAAFDLASDLFGVVNTQLQNVRAAKSLKASLARADPIIADVATLAERQVGAARKNFNEAINVQGVALERTVGDIRQIDKDLAALEIDAERTLADLSLNSSGEAKRKSAMTELERIRTGRAALAPRMMAYRKNMGELEERKRAGEEIFDATAVAIREWRASHAEVVEAMAERRPISIASLTTATEDLNELAKRWRDL